MENNNSIDNAIQSCQNIIQTHRRSTSLLLIAVILTLSGFFSYFIFTFTQSQLSDKEKINTLKFKNAVIEKYADSLYQHLPDSLKSQHQFSGYPINDIALEYENIKTGNTSNLINYGIYFFGIVVISILTALYRLHIKEIGRTEQNLIAFYRIRIAANNYKDGFDTEVRRSLTDSAFYKPIEQTEFFSRKSKIENPVPGHPTSEIVITLLNKILDNLEIKPKK